MSPPPGAGPRPGQRQTWPWVAAGAAAIILLICCAWAIIVAVRDDDEPDGGASPSPTVSPSPTRSPSPTTQSPQSPTPTTRSPQPTRTGPASPSLPGIGDPVRDGRFEFTVREVQCGVQSVGDPVVRKTAQGQYCLVTMTVRNIADRPQTMIDSDQEGIGSNGADYNADSEAGLIENEDTRFSYNEINPGNQVTGVLVFDIPDNVNLVRLVLHDSELSGGVEVSLS